MSDSMPHFGEFLDSYLTAALWSSTDNADDSGGEPLDKNYDSSDIEEESLENLTAIARVWYYRNSCYIAALIEQGVEPDTRQGAWSLYELAGHDLWLTQNGHGAGFQDREHWGVYKDLFIKQAQNLGEIDLTVSEGEIYA